MGNPDEVLGVFCGVSIIVGIITVLGHGIWLLLAWLYRMVSGQPSQPKLGTHCSMCGSPHGLVGTNCIVCGAPASAGKYERLRSDQNATRRQLNRWLEHGQIGAEVHQQLSALLHSGEQAPPPASTTQPIPVEPTAGIPAGQAVSTPVPNVRPEPQPPIEILEIAEEPIYVADVVDSPFVAAAPVPRTETPFPPPTAPRQELVPPAPRRTFADMLQAFMDDKNIRWAEIISGVLIVVSAVGLVISLRATLKDKIPYFPALSFMLVTAAIHASGIYSLRRWNLKRTSRGVLIIATLLVPLSFLASIILSGEGEQQRAVSDPRFLLAVVIGLASFATMNYFASRALVRHGWWRLMTAVLGTSIGQLLINRLHPGESTPEMAALLLSVPLGAFLVATGSLLWMTARRGRIGQRPAGQFYLELGIAVFALLAPVGLFIAKSDGVGKALGDLSPVLSLAASIVLACGLLGHRRMTGPPMTGYRTAGTALAILGAGAMLLMVAFAWPQLELLLAVGAVNFVVLTMLAFSTQLPLLHVLAVGCLSLAFLSGFHLVLGIDPAAGTSASIRLVRAIFTGRSGLALTLFATLVAAVGGGFISRRRQEDGLYYLSASGVLAALCVAIATFAGFVGGESAQPDLATPIFLYVGIAALVTGWFVSRAEATVGGAVLFLMACIHGLYLNEWLRAQLDAIGLLPTRPILVAFLAASVTFGLLAVAALVQLRRRRNDQGESTPAAELAARTIATFKPLAWSAVATSLCALPFALFVRHEQFGEHAAYVACASIAWLCLASAGRDRFSFSVFQSLATIAIAYVTASVCARQSWWQHEIFDARHVYAQLAVLAMCCAAWSLARIQFRKHTVFHRLFPREWTIDEVLLAVLTVGLLIAAARGALPGIQFELGFAGVSASAIGAADPHRLWYAGSAWAAWGFVLLGLGAAAWEGVTRLRGAGNAALSPAETLEATLNAQKPRVALFGMVVVTATAALLVAGRFDDQIAVASATRWLFGLLTIAWCVPASYWGGGQTKSNHSAASPLLVRSSDVMQFGSLLFGAGTVLALTTLSVWCASVGYSPGGPAAESFFARVGPAVSYATPMAMLVVVLFAYAIREAQPGHALAASVVFQYGLSLACLLPVFTSGASVDALALAKLLQWNAIGLGIFTCAWVAARKWIEPERAKQVWPPVGFDLLQIQVGVLVVVQLSIAAWIAGQFFLDPAGPLAEAHLLGRWPGYVGIVAAASGLIWLTRRAPWKIPTHVACVVSIVLVHIVAATIDSLDVTRQWWGHHALSAGRSLAAAAMTGWAVWLTRLRPIESQDNAVGSIRASVMWATAASVLAALAAIRESTDDPLRPWWPGGIMIACASLAGVLAIRGRRQGFAYYSTVLGVAAATVVFAGLAVGHPLSHGAGFIALHVTALGIMSCLWLACEIWWQKRGEPGLDPRSSAIGKNLPVHRVSGWAATVGGAIFLPILGLVLAFASQPVAMNRTEVAAAIMAFASFLFLQTGSMWDRRATNAIPGLYVWFLCAGAFAVERLAFGNMTRIVAMLAVVATHVALTGWLWSWGSKLAVLGHRLGVFEPVEGLRRAVRWLPAATLLLSAAVISLSLVVVLGSETRELRVTAASLPFLLAAGIAGLAQQHRRDAMQLMALLVAGLAGVYLGWADIHPDWSDKVWLLRSIRLLMALSVLAFVFGAVVVRVLSLESSWRQAARRAAVIVSGLAVAVLLLVLAMEVATFTPGMGAPVDAIQIAAVSVVLVALLVALLSLAVLPGRDPFALTERGRMLYVYGAQVVGGLLFAHIYLTMPWVFRGVLRPYWPYIVVTIAFAGVGVGELFQRLGLRVLSEPFQRSGAFLPLVPAIGMWVANSDSSYSLVMFVMGVMYLLLSFSQKSVLAGVAAGIAGNTALWSLLNGSEDLTFSNHPQFWLIPPAVSVLVAAQINRTRLSAVQLAATRYAAVAVIYLSSTAEILAIGIGESLWPPIILTALSVAGVFFGIAMRVRAYLYVGGAFILVSSLTMVAHAARSIDHVWPWWAFLFAMGVMILVIFGSFEARRTQILAMIERLRQWEK